MNFKFFFHWLCVHLALFVWSQAYIWTQQCKKLGEISGRRLTNFVEFVQFCRIAYQQHPEFINNIVFTWLTRSLMGDKNNVHVSDTAVDQIIRRILYISVTPYISPPNQPTRLVDTMLYAKQVFWSNSCHVQCLAWLYNDWPIYCHG